jgi:hypothetical protein
MVVVCMPKERPIMVSSNARPLICVAIFLLQFFSVTYKITTKSTFTFLFDTDY